MSRCGLALVVLSGLLDGCRAQRGEIDLRPTIEEDPLPASTVQVADSATAGQLVRGFYSVEGGSWRWTSRGFTVRLRPPAGTVQTGAKLVLAFSLPDAVMSRLHSVTITPRVGDESLPPQTFNSSGSHVLSVPVQGSLLSRALVEVSFTLDHYLASGTVDGRELGLIVTSVGLERP